MSDAALRQLDDAQAVLVAALEAHDLDAIESANVAVAVAVEQMRVVGGWRDRPGLRDDLVHVLKRAEAARGRVNALADQNRRKLAKLVALSGPAQALAYGRSGRLS